MGNKMFKSALLVIPLITLTGCASRAPLQQYNGKPDDPSFLTQSTPNMAGTAERWSGTYFDVFYRNDQQECRRLFSEKLRAPVDDAKLQAQFDGNQGIRLPANQLVSVTALFSQRIIMGGGSALETHCPEVAISVLTEPRAKYLFEFSHPYGRCVLQAFKIESDGKRNQVPVIPGNICDPKNGKN
jgi:hypothetical protein